MSQIDAKLEHSLRTPPFLFRAASDQSRGINTKDFIDPLHGSNATYHKDLAALEYDSSARWMLCNHINNEYKAPSEFISWSVSLLYVLIHGVRKLYALGQTNTLIYVLDTRKVPVGRIYRATDLLKKYCTYRQPQLEEYALGEFLLHGPSSNTGCIWRAVPLSQLIVTGLFDAFPELTYGSSYNRLLTTVKNLRCTYFENSSEMTGRHLKIFHNMSRRFGIDNAWESGFFVAIIATRARSMTVEFETSLLDEIKGLKLPEHLRNNGQMRATQLIVHDIPESRALYQILRLADRHAAHDPGVLKSALDRLPGITKMIWPDDRGLDLLP